MRFKAEKRMVRSWVFVGLAVFGSVNRAAMLVAQDAPVAAAFQEKARTVTARQHEWLKATPEQRVGLSELLGDDGARALAKKNGYEAICDGVDRTLPQGPDQVYRAPDGRTMVYEAKGGSSPVGRAYGYEQGTPEWAVESAKRVLKSAKAGPAEKTAAAEILRAAVERRLTVEVVRTKHRLGEPFLAVVEQSLNTTDDAARLARSALDGLVPPAANAIDDAARASAPLADDGASTVGKLAKAAPRIKAGRVAGKALIPLGLVIDGVCRAEDTKATEQRFASGEITQQQREIEHAKNGAGLVGGWTGAWAGAEIGATTGGAIGTAMAPGPGTAIGVAVGGAVGGVTGYFAGEAVAAEAAGWAVAKVHRTGNTLQAGWNWGFRN
jgi:hypothetical protein